jgi:hypothetical protein
VGQAEAQPFSAFVFDRLTLRLRQFPIPRNEVGTAFIVLLYAKSIKLTLTDG